jgi:hypothetical protein
VEIYTAKIHIFFQGGSRLVVVFTFLAERSLKTGAGLSPCYLNAIVSPITGK